jgi:hypothetical protein
MKFRISFRMVPLTALLVTPASLVVPAREPDWLDGAGFVYVLLGTAAIGALIGLCVVVFSNVGVQETALGWYQRNGEFHADVSLQDGQRFVASRFGIKVLHTSGYTTGTRYLRWLFTSRDWERVQELYPAPER